MKRFTAIIISAAMLFCLSGCGEAAGEQPEEQVNYEIAMVTDAEMIMDGGYSEVAWEAITEFGTENGVSHKYYKAAEASSNAYSDVISDAVEKGAKVIIADGYAFEDVVYEAQKEYKDVNFVLIDAEPQDGKSHKVSIAKNTATILFASEQAGYFAGYAAVQEGYRELGFIGESDKPVIEDYGMGFVQGADSAAQEYGVSVDVKYHYVSAEEDNDAVMKKASQWYKNGTEVVFACGALVEQPVVQAAELNDGKVIGSETDKSEMSDTVITSAVKDIDGAIENILEQCFDGEFPGGEVVHYDALNEGVGIEMDNSGFENFGHGDYKSEMQAVAEGNVIVKNSDKTSLKKLDLMYVNIEMK